MKVLVLCDSIDANASSGAKGRIALIKSFMANKASVTILHYSHKELTIDDAECILVKESKMSLLFLLSRIQRKLYRWFKIDLSKYIDTVFGFSFGFFNDVNSFFKALKAFDVNDYAMVWSLSNGDSYRNHRALLKDTRWHDKWYAYIHDPYPQQLYPRPFNFVPYGYKQKRMFLTEVTKKAHRVVFPSLLLKQWMQSYYVEIKGKSLIVPHQNTTSKKADVELPSYFDSTKFNVLHAGNLLSLRDPKPLVLAFTKFLEIEPQAKLEACLTFVGRKSIYSEYLQKMANEYTQIFTSDYLPFDVTYAMQQLTCVNVILEAESEISPFLPGKFPHCVAANKPILAITPYYSETKRILGTDYNLLFDFKDVESMAQSLVSLYKEWKLNLEGVTLNRLDIEHYLSPTYLEEIITKDKTC